jgi:hypothetical protein
VLNEVAGNDNLRLNGSLRNNDWTETFYAATNQERQIRVLNYFESDFSPQIFATNLLQLLAQFKKGI